MFDFIYRRRVAIIGITDNDSAVIAWLLGHEAEVTVCHYSPALRLAWSTFEHRVTWRLGPEYLDHLGDFDTIIVGESVGLFHPAIQSLRPGERQVMTLFDLFLHASPAPVIALTSPVRQPLATAFIHECLAGQTTGRIIELTQGVGEAFKQVSSLQPSDWVICSLHPQPLERSPHIIGVIPDETAVSSDDDLADRTISIVNHQQPGDYLILPAEWSGSTELAGQSVAQTWRTSTREPVQVGLWIQWLESTTGRVGHFVLRTPDGEEFDLGTTNDLVFLPGHELMGLVIALMICFLVTNHPAAISQTLHQFRGPLGYNRYVGMKQGVAIYDNSHTLDSAMTVRDLQGFRVPVSLLVDMPEAHNTAHVLATLQDQSVAIRHIVLISSRRDQSHHVNNSSVYIVHSLEEAIQTGVRLSQPGDALVYSPSHPTTHHSVAQRSQQFEQFVQRMVYGA